MLIATELVICFEESSVGGESHDKLVGGIRCNAIRRRGVANHSEYEQAL
jgi:hypothetical protein